MSSYAPTECFKPNEPGIYLGLSMGEYQKAPGVSGSDLTTLQKSPAAYQRGERPTPTEAMQFGTLANDLLLFNTHSYHVPPETYRAPESQKKDAALIDKPWNWNAAVCQQWREQHADKPVIRRSGAHSQKWLEALAAKAILNPASDALISDSLHEVSVFARCEDYPVLRKGRLDGLILRPDGSARIVELKTTLDASTPAFAREILKRGYHRKAAYYRDLLHSLGISPVEFWFIALEKGEHPRVNVRRLAERAMDKGDFDNDDALTLLMNCKLRNFWPDFADEQEPGVANTEPVIDLPDFAYSASVDDLKGMTEIETDSNKEDPA